MPVFVNNCVLLSDHVAMCLRLTMLMSGQVDINFRVVYLSGMRQFLSE